jgi:hypothetical protein
VRGRELLFGLDARTGSAISLDAVAASAALTALSTLSAVPSALGVSTVVCPW